MKQNVVRRHTSWCVATPCRHTKSLFFSNFYVFLTNFRRFLADFAYFCRFSASSETFHQLLVVFTPKICIIKKFGVSTHILKIKLKKPGVSPSSMGVSTHHIVFQHRVQLWYECTEMGITNLHRLLHQSPSNWRCMEKVAIILILIWNIALL